MAIADTLLLVVVWVQAWYSSVDHLSETTQTAMWLYYTCLGLAIDGGYTETLGAGGIHIHIHLRAEYTSTSVYTC